MTDSEANTLAENRLIEEIRAEARKQIARWILGAVVFLLGVSALGWWLYLQPIIKQYIIDTGGVPVNGIIVSSMPCSELDGDWAEFTEGGGRFLVGAGDARLPAFGSWISETDRKTNDLSVYESQAVGGEESHILSNQQIPSFTPQLVRSDGQPFDMRLTDVVPCIGSGCNQWLAVTNGFREGQHSNIPLAFNSIGAGQAHNNLPPYIAVHYCKKTG